MHSGKKSLLLMVAVFVTPVLLGALLYFNMDRLGFSRSSINYGELIQPALPLKAGKLLYQGKPVKAEKLFTKKWTMLYIEQGQCEQHCLDQLLLIKRIRLLMNEQMRRVRTVLVAKSEHIAEISKKTSKNNPDLVFAALANPDDMLSFMSQFTQLEKSPVYLVDPLGNLMMVYPQDKPDAKKMIRDLSRLLKYSRLG